jgi:hypothetical protein
VVGKAAVRQVGVQSLRQPVLLAELQLELLQELELQLELLQELVAQELDDHELLLQLELS